MMLYGIVSIPWALDKVIVGGNRRAARFMMPGTHIGAFNLAVSGLRGPGLAFSLLGGLALYKIQARALACPALLCVDS